MKVWQPVESCSGIMLTRKSLLLCNAIVTIGFKNRSTSHDPENLPEAIIEHRPGNRGKGGITI